MCGSSSFLNLFCGKRFNRFALLMRILPFAFFAYPQLIHTHHFEAAFSTKPRARVMVYRDWLCDLAPVVKSYVQALCHKRRAEMNPQMIALYELAQEVGNADFVAALELAVEQQMYGAEYVRAIVSVPTAS